MANTLKSKKQSKISEENLNPDKEADVSVTDVVKDERTSKIMGVISLLITLFLFVSFTSYLFTWQDDQDMVQLWRTHLFSINDLKVNNLMGYIGAFVAYQIMFNGFGLAAYLFCSFFFVRREFIFY
jgi:S-DNA-T family DNA segregation ATPase FtsK/SpoIIIE